MVMNKVNVFEVKAKLSEYLDRAARGERIVICRHNKPVAELRAIVDAVSTPRTIGPIPGRPTFDVPASFFELLPEDDLEQWEGISGSDPLSAGLAPPKSSRSARVAEPKGVHEPRRKPRPPRRRS
jgi:antitoxin (DNA-binding transcriptional repressor) of toxin-antitoxin stability system